MFYFSAKIKKDFKEHRVPRFDAQSFTEFFITITIPTLHADANPQKPT